MIRHLSEPRADWRHLVESQGFLPHSEGGQPHWDESACYELTTAEVDTLEATAAELQRLCLEAAEAIVRRGWWRETGISPEQVPLVTKSWEEREFSLYGRFDVITQPDGQPKLLEYNADTPTSLVESAVLQWHWLHDTRPDADQFNSLHERLVAAWERSGLRRVHFTAVEDSAEDGMTALYLQDTAAQARLETALLPLDRIGWAEEIRRFVDDADEPIDALCKLYPWEWMLTDAFAGHIPDSSCRFVEPAWKMLLANKGLLPILWELFPDHPALLPAYRHAAPLGGNHVRKPVHSRDGANVTFFRDGKPDTRTNGPYQNNGWIYQAIAEAAPLAGQYPVAGLWIVDGQPAGLGIREDASPITGGLSRFVPHFFQPENETTG